MYVFIQEEGHYEHFYLISTKHHFISRKGTHFEVLKGIAPNKDLFFPPKRKNRAAQLSIRTTACPRIRHVSAKFAHMRMLLASTSYLLIKAHDMCAHTHMLAYSKQMLIILIGPAGPKAQRVRIPCTVYASQAYSVP